MMRTIVGLGLALVVTMGCDGAAKKIAADREHHRAVEDRMFCEFGEIHRPTLSAACDDDKNPYHLDDCLAVIDGRELACLRFHERVRLAVSR